MSSRLFRRAWKLQVDTLDVSGLAIEFKILATTKTSPNKGVITVWNLNADHRSQMLKRNQPSPGRLVGVPLQLEAGYTDNTSVLLSADMREVGSSRDRTAWKTVYSGDDGGRAMREARINQTFTKGTPVSTILQQCCSALGIGLGNAARFEAGAAITGYGTTIPHTFVASGNVSKELTRLLDSMNLQWSVQRGALQLQQKGKPLDLGAILLSPQTGLIGSPEAAMDSTIAAPSAKGATASAPQKKTKPKDPSVLKIKAMLIPGLVPGRKIVLQCKEFPENGYQLTECEYVGQSFGKDWHVNMIARVY